MTWRGSLTHAAHTMESTATAWLETAKGERIPVGGTCSIGRDAQNTVVVAGEKISRRHALIHAQNESEFWLVDLGSTNGTFRNSRQIKQPTQLQSGDTISVGSVEFKLHVQRSTSAPRLSSDELAQTMVTQRMSNVWIVVTDVENFTPMSQTLPTPELTRKLGAWLLECTDIVEGTGGCIDKYVGDGFLAYWEHQRLPAKSFAPVAKKLSELQTAASLKFRWILHNATLQLGHSRFQNDSLIGKEINFAFRMEKIAGSLQLPRLLSKPAAEPLQKLIATRAVGLHPVKGFDRDFEFFTF